MLVHQTQTAFPVVRSLFVRRYVRCPGVLLFAVLRLRGVNEDVDPGSGLVFVRSFVGYIKLISACLSDQPSLSQVIWTSGRSTTRRCGIECGDDVW